MVVRTSWLATSRVMTEQTGRKHLHAALRATRSPSCCVASVTIAIQGESCRSLFEAKPPPGRKIYYVEIDSVALVAD